MSLKPRHVDFQETWAGLKETVAGVVALRGVERGVWSARFSDVYALCVAHPEPLADKLYDETRRFLEEHVSTLLDRVQGREADDQLLHRYVEAWQEYSQGIKYLNSLYSYLNLQHIKRQKVSDAEIIYGSAAVSCTDHESRQLEIGELGLVTWERVLLRALGGQLTRRVVAALAAAREERLPPPAAAAAAQLQAAVLSTVAVAGARPRAPLAVYERLVLQPYLAAAAHAHAQRAAALLEAGDVAHYMRHALLGLEREAALARRFLHASSLEAVRGCYERHAVVAHLPLLHAHAAPLMAAAAEGGAGEERRGDVRRLYRLLRPLGGDATRPLLDAARLQAAAAGRALLHATAHGKDEAHTHFVSAMLTVHGTYTELFQDVFGGAQPFMGALDKACSEVVNSRVSADSSLRAAELLARYCDGLLRRRCSRPDNVDDKLAAAIVVFKYVDDKDVFQKFYARALARRLIHQQCANMELEEAMINRLKAACGYEFTNKLHRMFTDVAVSADLNARFQEEERAHQPFYVQVLQAGAWPLGAGAGTSAGAPAPLLAAAQQFDTWYRAAFSGRRLAWLHHLCSVELRTKFTPRTYHLNCTAHQCGILLQFETVDRWSSRELRDSLQLTPDAYSRHVKPLIDIGLLTAEGHVISESTEDSEALSGHLTLNLQFTCKRTKIKLPCAATNNSPGGGGGGEGGEAYAAPAAAGACDDDRKMYLQAALVRIMKQRKVLGHGELVREASLAARGSFAPSVALVKKCIEALIDKQYLERTPGALDTYSYLA